MIGSRLGFIVGGGAILWALDWLDWKITFLVLAGLVLLNTLPILCFKEPVRFQHIQQVTDKEAFSWKKIKSYLNYFHQSRSLTLWLVVLVTFKVADGLSGPLLKPLMVDMGLTFSQIGIYVTMLGALAALIGAGLAGLSLKYISRANALLSFSVLKIFSLGAYAWLAFQYEAQQPIKPWLIYGINAAEDMISAMLLVVMLTLVMQYSRKNFAATDFTFQVALMATVSGGLYSLSGILGDLLGYADYLAFITVVAVICLLPVLRWKATLQ